MMLVMKMENKNDKYKNLLEKLKELISGNHSINEIQEFLNYIDSIALCYNFDEDFLLPFYNLLEIKKEKDTIGEELFNNCLSNKERLTPSLLMYFYLKQKDILGFKYTYNKFKFLGAGIACTEHNDDKYIFFNYCYYLDNFKENDVFNYQCMETILHELVHIYQFSINPNTDDMYEKLICNDRELFLLSHDYGILSYNYLHDNYLIEYHANVCSKYFMINFAKDNPNYFDNNFVETRKNYFFEKIAYSNSHLARDLFKKYIELYSEMSNNLYKDYESNTNKDDQNLSVAEFISKKELGLTRIKELLDKDRLLRLYVDEHPDKQDSIRNFFLGVGTYDINIIRNNCFSDEKKNTK